MSIIGKEQFDEYAERHEQVQERVLEIVNRINVVYPLDGYNSKWLEDIDIEEHNICFRYEESWSGQTEIHSDHFPRSLIYSGDDAIDAYAQARVRELEAKDEKEKADTTEKMKESKRQRLAQLQAEQEAGEF